MIQASPSGISRNWLVRYAIAILATVVALLVRLALNPILGDYVPYILLFPAVAFSAWYCGLGPSVLSVVLGLLGTDYWFISPIHSFSILDKAQLVSIVAFVCVSAIIIIMAEANRRATEELQKSHDELDSRVKERTAELDLVQDSLRKLTGHLLQLRDNEQRRLARELHDSVGQLLVAANINLSFVEAEAQKLTPKAANAIADAIILLQQTITGVRSASYFLHPPLLDDVGLNSALCAYAEGFADRTNIRVDLTFSPDLGRLARDLEITIFRVVQEALANIHRHSGSRTADVSIVRSPETVRVEIRDHGRGIPHNELSSIEVGRAPGIGIGGMRERVREVGGTLAIESNGNGTRVIVQFPVPSDESRQLAS